MEALEPERWAELLARAEAGDRDAQWEVGYFHEYGGGDGTGGVIVAPDQAQAIHWYTLAAQAGDASAQCALSNLLSTGDSAERDFKRAIFWAKKAVAQGTASAAYNLATIYRDLQRPKLALRWYERAAAMGDGDALLQIGLCRMFGFGTGQDWRGAAECFEALRSNPDLDLCQRSQEDSAFWAAVLQLLQRGAAGSALAGARARLEEANADDDHEQANALLNLIGKSRHLAG